MQFSYNIYLKLNSKIQMFEKYLSQEMQSGLEHSQKMKRSSKICSALKNRFLAMLQEDGTTIKNAAKHLGINYSTAKVIAKENRHLLKEKNTSHSDNQEEYLPTKEKRIQVLKKEIPRCGYRQINVEDESQNLGDSIVPEIYIVSTVAWNFLQFGLPNIQEKNID